jgi:hypothetical protein
MPPPTLTTSILRGGAPSCPIQNLEIFSRNLHFWTALSPDGTLQDQDLYTLTMDMLQTPHLKYFDFMLALSLKLNIPLENQLRQNCTPPPPTDKNPFPVIFHLNTGSHWFLLFLLKDSLGNLHALYKDTAQNNERTRNHFLPSFPAAYTQYHAVTKMKWESRLEGGHFAS